jgi:hypothetical protein
MTSYIVYAARIKDPHFTYTGEAEAWRENVDLLFQIGSGMSFMTELWRQLREGEIDGELGADWATSIAHVDKDTLRGYSGHGRLIDVDAWRPYLPCKSDDEVRELMHFDTRRLVDLLPDDQQYAIVGVEGID